MTGVCSGHTKVAGYHRVLKYSSSTAVNMLQFIDAYQEFWRGSYPKCTPLITGQPCNCIDANILGIAWCMGPRFDVTRQHTPLAKNTTNFTYAAVNYFSCYFMTWNHGSQNLIVCTIWHSWFSPYGLLFINLPNWTCKFIISSLRKHVWIISSTLHFTSAAILPSFVCLIYVPVFSL